MSNLTSIPDPARIAAAAFADRQAQARRMVRDRAMPLAEAERRLAPWLAIACLAGADLPELAAPLADRVTRDLSDHYQITEAMARAELAPTICPRARWAPLLGAARDAALRSAAAVCGSARSRPDETANALEQARGLQALAAALCWDPMGRHHVPAYHQKEAA